MARDGRVSAPVRVIVADDEPGGRRTLELLLAQDPEMTLVGTCRSGAETVKAVLSERPDLLLLDIQMPGGDGFGVLNELPVESRPLVVFVTAHENYSLKAFDVEAVDYLIKPFSDRRFREAMGRVKQRLKLIAGQRPPADEVLAVRSNHGVALLPVADIEWIEARGDYARLHSSARRDLVRESLASLERRLEPHRFVRIHRSAMVNLSRVQEFRMEANGAMVAVLRSGQRCRLSRRGRERVAAQLAVPV